MDSKKKMIISISAVAMVILAAIVAVVAVLAAQQVTIKSSVDVTYNATDIYGGSQVRYQVGTGAEQTLLSAVTFAGGDNENATASKNDIGLTKTNYYVTFMFDFKKDDGAENYYVTLTYTKSATANKNVKISYGTSPDSLTDKTVAATGDTTLATNVEISSTDYTTLYVRVSVQDTRNDAAFSGDFNCSLTNTAPAS